jgi:hypothetical protein
VNRDILEEEASLNMYRAFRNCPLAYYDYLGLEDRRTGGNEGRYVFPNNSQASQPSIDKAQACCRYHTSTYSEESVSIRKHESNERCSDNALNPESCCCACGTKQIGMTSAQTTFLIKASWGKCCICRVERRREAVTAGQHILVREFQVPHTAVFVKCNDGRRWYLDHAGKDGSPVTGHTDDYSDVAQSTWTRQIAKYPVVQDFTCVACDEVSKLINYSDSMDGKQYNWRQDCYWFGRGCMNKTRDLVQSDGNCPSLP